MNGQPNNGSIILYQTEDGKSRIEVTLCNDTVWLTADQMAELFQRNKSTISRHIKNVFEDGELQSDMVVAKMQQPLSTALSKECNKLIR